MSVFIRTHLHEFADDVLGSVPKLLHLSVAIELVAHIDDAVRTVEGSCLTCLFFVQQEMDGGVGTSSGCADEGTEEDICQRVDEVVHLDDVGRDDAWVGCVDRDTFVLQAVGKFECEECQSQFCVAINRDSPEASLPATSEEIREVKASDAISQ